MAARTLAIIPARGGSERIPRKNLMPLAGLPVVAHSIRHALAAAAVDEVVVSTDDDEIAAVAHSFGAEVVRRPPELSTAEATSESALLHVLDARRADGHDDPELVVFLQCTSPVRRRGDIDAAVATLRETGADSVFSATDSRWLLWADAADGPRPLNYDFERRRREQDMAREVRENGSIYVTRTELLRERGNRLGGRIAIHEMDYWSSFQLDAPEDAELLEWILGRPEYRLAEPLPDPIALLVFDFDGVMTDNRVVVHDGGGESVVASRADGWGVARLHDAGVPMLVLSTETHPVVQARCDKLRLECHQGVDSKAAHLERLLDDRGIDPRHVVYVGNDVNDLGAFAAVGYSVAVGDAHPEIAAAARLVLSRPGGQGAVRELADLVLRHVGAVR